MAYSQLTEQTDGRMETTGKHDLFTFSVDKMKQPHNATYQRGGLHNQLSTGTVYHDGKWEVLVARVQGICSHYISIQEAEQEMRTPELLAFSFRCCPGTTTEKSASGSSHSLMLTKNKPQQTCPQGNNRCACRLF